MSTDKIKVKVAIIGGSGLNDPDLLENQVERFVQTPFGQPSDALLEGTIKGVPCVVLSRHGRKHSIQPSDVNYRANIWALKEAGCTHILAATATGSLREDYQPGDLVVVDDFIDRTWGRKCTFYDQTPGGPRGICHLTMMPAFCEQARSVLIESIENKGFKYHKTGTCVAIQGPRFSSRAESLMFKQWGGHIINMTIVPEVVLAKEAGLSYAALALVTDYDCWRDNEKAVSMSEVLETMKGNAIKAIEVLTEAVQIIAAQNDLEYLNENREAAASAVLLKD